MHYVIAGRDRVMEEVHLWLVYGLAATGALWSLLFLINLNLAPYRIERDARVELELELQRIPRALRPDTRLIDLGFDDNQLRKLTDLASIGAIKVWGRGEGTGIIGYPIQENNGDRRARTIERIQLCESHEESNLRELDRETWENWRIIRKLKSNAHHEIDLFEEGLNAIENNNNVGLGAAIFDITVNKKQVIYELSRTRI